MHKLTWVLHCISWWFGVYNPFNIIQVILRWRKCDNESSVQWSAIQLWAEYHIYPKYLNRNVWANPDHCFSVGFEPRTSWSKVGRANHSATWALRIIFHISAPGHRKTCKYSEQAWKFMWPVICICCLHKIYRNMVESILVFCILVTYSLCSQLIQIHIQNFFNQTISIFFLLLQETRKNSISD